MGCRYRRWVLSRGGRLWRAPAWRSTRWVAAKEIAGYPALCLRRWRHGRQHPAGALRRALHGRCWPTGHAAEPDERVTIAGRYCESGDILISDTLLASPRGRGHLGRGGLRSLRAGDGIELQHGPASGDRGRGRRRATLWRRRETYADLLRCEAMRTGAPHPVGLELRFSAQDAVEQRVGGSWLA